MYRSRLDALARRSLLRRIRTIDSTPGAEVELEGRRILLFSSNNYLDLAAHPRIARDRGEVEAVRRREDRGHRSEDEKGRGLRDSDGRDQRDAVGSGDLTRCSTRI